MGSRLAYFAPSVFHLYQISDGLQPSWETRPGKVKTVDVILTILSIECSLVYKNIIVITVRSKHLKRGMGPLL